MFSLISLPALVGALGGPRTLAVLSPYSPPVKVGHFKCPERPIFRRVPLFLSPILLLFVLKIGLGIPKVAMWTMGGRQVRGGSSECLTCRVSLGLDMAIKST